MEFALNMALRRLDAREDTRLERLAADVADVESALRDYDRRHDRPPVFVGRASERAFLHDTVAAAQSGAEGITAVVQGVPGVGKSALSRQFQKEIGATMVDGKLVAVVAKDCDFFNRPPVSMVKELAADLAEQAMSCIDPLLPFDMLPWLATKQKLGVSLYAALCTFAAKMNLDSSLSLGAALDTFAENVWPAGVTLILAVDEMQNMEDTPQVRRNLQAIHGKRFDTNIAIVGFGLQNTAARLRGLGLSRLGADQVRALGCMDGTDAARLVDETFDHLGLASEHDRWRYYAGRLGFGFEDWTCWRNAAKAVILEESANFPHHLVGGVRAVCRIVLAGELRHPGRRELSMLRERCRNSKREYCAARLAPVANHTLALAAALRNTNDAGEVDTAVVLGALEECGNDGRDTDAETATTVLDNLFDTGLLQRRGATMAAVEVPSLAGYLADELDRSLLAGGVGARTLAAALQIKLPK